MQLKGHFSALSIMMADLTVSTGPDKQKLSPLNSLPMVGLSRKCVSRKDKAGEPPFYWRKQTINIRNASPP
ncbi:hypothetical protein [Pantoea sp. Ep11b]|uniref:hypothetical protein n=1 Tax=unclassified Pantoea TaxID=2630326 RepID=UPI00345FBE88